MATTLPHHYNYSAKESTDLNLPAKKYLIALVKCEIESVFSTHVSLSFNILGSLVFDKTCYLGLY